MAADSILIASFCNYLEVFNMARRGLRYDRLSNTVVCDRCKSVLKSTNTTIIDHQEEDDQECDEGCFSGGESEDSGKDFENEEERSLRLRPMKQFLSFASPVDERAIEARLDTPAAIFLLQKGFNKSLIKMAVIELMNLKEPEIETGSCYQLLEKVLQLQDANGLELLSEYEKLVTLPTSSTPDSTIKRNSTTKTIMVTKKVASNTSACDVIIVVNGDPNSMKAPVKQRKPTWSFMSAIMKGWPFAREIECSSPSKRGTSNSGNRSFSPLRETDETDIMFSGLSSHQLSDLQLTASTNECGNRSLSSLRETDEANYKFFYQ